MPATNTLDDRHAAHLDDDALTGLRVFAYWNLHRSVWSLRALEGDQRGRVVAYRTLVRLDDVTGRVSEAGRQRVIREQRKNVHAGIVGRVSDQDEHQAVGHRITYNPYRSGTFHYADDQARPFRGAPWALLETSDGRARVYVPA